MSTQCGLLKIHFYPIISYSTRRYKELRNSLLFSSISGKHRNSESDNDGGIFRSSITAITRALELDAAMCRIISLHLRNQAWHTFAFSCMKRICTSPANFQKYCIQRNHRHS